MYKLRVSEFILVRMNGATTDENGADKPFKLAVLSKRQTPAQIDAHIAARRSLNELMLELTTECREQDVLINEAGEAAPASMETLGAIIDGVAHIGGVWWDAYLQVNGAKAKQGN